MSRKGAVLVEAIPTGAAIADKGYDSYALVDIRYRSDHPISNQ
jgi:hypothetical protein